MLTQDYLANPEGYGAGPETVPWSGRQVIWGIGFLILGGILVILVALVLIAVYRDLNEALVTVASSLVLGLIILIIVWVLALRGVSGPIAPLLGFRFPKQSLVITGLWTGAALGISMLFTFLYTSLINWLGWELLLPPQTYGDIVFEGPAVIFTFLALAVWTPLTEEIFFRGFVFSGLIRSRGLAGALITSAVIFSSFHIMAGPGVLIPIVVTGLLFAYLYHRTGSLWPPIIAHAGQNGAALLATIYGL